MIDITTVEDAIWSWVVAASGLAADRVIWADRGPVPAELFFSLALGDILPVGQDSLDRDLVVDPAPGADELRYVVRGPRLVTLTIQCLPAQGDAETGTGRCTALLGQVLTKRRLPSIAAGLSAAGIGFGPPAGARWVPGSFDGRFEPRAVVDVTIHLAEEISETAPTIRHVEIETVIDEGAPLTDWVPDAPT